MDSKIVEMSGIYKSFGRVYALKGVDFDVNRGEVVGLVGNNGAGKSTLIKILSGLLPADKGEIFLNGKKVHFSSPREARKNGIETVYQEQALADDLSVARNLFMGKEPLRWVGPIRLLDHRTMEKKSKEMSHELHLDIDPDKEVRFCSGGEQQGIAIARAIHFKANLIILDEPTRALGVAATHRVLDLVRNLKERGIACILISHNLYHVYPVSDRIVVLKQGMKLEDILKENTSIDELTQLMI